MNIGKLRHRVEIQRLVDGVQDAQTGDVTRAWVTQRSVWASIDAVSGREYLSAQAAQSEVTSRITVRMTDVIPKDRIVYNGVYYNVHAVLPDNVGGQRYLTIMVSSGVNDGGASHG